MPAVVRGGRRQAGVQATRGAAQAAQGRARAQKPARTGARAARNASGVPAKLAAIGRLELSSRGVAISLAAGAAVLAMVLFGGSQAGRLVGGLSDGLHGVAGRMGLKVSHIHVAGASAEAAPAIQAALALETGTPITALDLDALRERVEAVGWVESARVMRLLPHTLVVDVTEHNRLAVWQLNGRIQVIDGQGRVIPGADARRYPDLPLVVGAGAEEGASVILPLIAERPRLAGRVDALVRVDGRRWDLRLKDGGLIQLPAMEEEGALILLDALDQRERVLEMGFARLDLRTPGDFAIRLNAGEAAGA